jgi:hypothetical protein
MNERIHLLVTKSIAWLRRFRIEVSITIILFILTLLTRLPVTLSFPIEVGIDGAYYTLNVYTLLNGGFLYYDAPIVVFAIAGFFSLIAQDIIVGVKIASAFFEGVLVVGIFYAAWNYTEGDWRIGLIAGVLCWIDVSQFILSTSLVKN